MLLVDIAFFLLAVYFFYQISYSCIDISLKSPLNQRSQSFVFPKNFTSLQTPLYSKLIFVILDGITYDYVDNRVKDIPYLKDDCDIHVHQITVFNELLSKNPQSAILQRLEIEQPPKTEIKISTYLKGTNPVVFSMKIPEANPNKINMQDSVIYQVGQSDKLKKNYGFLTSYLYDYIGYNLNSNQFANLDLKYTEDSKVKEYTELIKSNNYDTLFIYEGMFDEISHSEGMHTLNGLEAQKKIDTLIRDVAKIMDEDAIMIVVSDHGKTERGAHFNCRDENIKVCNSVFFAYTKKGFIKDDKFIKGLRRKEADIRISKQAEQFSAHESMISSTISNLLNIPISFINSGRSLLEVYPISKFQNRIEMLQRILQDSFTTLKQQMQLYNYIQETKGIYDNQQFQQIVNQVNSIENSLNYDPREQIRNNEQRLEELITEITSIQNQIQDTIYSTKFYSNELLIFGIIFGGFVSLAMIVESFMINVMRNRQVVDFAFILIMSLYSCYIYFINEKEDIESYGFKLSCILMAYNCLNYQSQDFSKILIVLYYAPLPLIGQLFTQSNQDPTKYSKIEEDIETQKEIELQTQTVNKTNEKDSLFQTDNKSCNHEILRLKSGIILISSICILSSCIGQIWIIVNKKVFNHRTDEFIFNNEYLMLITISFLISNLFIYD